MSAVWDVTRGLPASSLMQLTDFHAFVHGLDHPEGVACGPGGEIYAGGEAGQVYLVEPDGGAFREIGNTGGFHLGLALDADRNVYACDLANHCVWRVSGGGETSVYSSGAPDRAMVTPNYPVFDAGGNLYVSDSGGFHDDNGCVFVVRPGGMTEVLATEGVSHFPNGMALSPDGRHLHVVISLLPGVVRLPVADGRVTGSAETVIELPHNIPDGIAFDAEGNLYIGCYTPDVIYRLTPGGELAVLASDWESVTFATPTNLAFCGPSRRTLVVASLSRWHLSKGEMTIPGARLNYPTLPETTNAS